MPRQNKTRYALLGLLSMQPASGYEMKKMMQASTSHFWREGDSAIYPILKQLLNEKLVTCKVDSKESSKSKKTYTITLAGIEVLKQWLFDVTEPYQSRNEFMLKVYFGWHINPKVMLNHIQKLRNDTLKTVEKFKGIQAEFSQSVEMKTDKIFRFLTLRAGVILNDAAISWCDEAIQLLENKVIAEADDEW